MYEMEALVYEVRNYWNYWQMTILFWRLIRKTIISAGHMEIISNPDESDSPLKK
jgi:hypothetical protein